MNDPRTISSMSAAQKILRKRQEVELRNVCLELTDKELSSMAAEHPLIGLFWKKASIIERQEFLRHYSLNSAHFFDSHLRDLQKAILDFCPIELKTQISEVAVGALRNFEVNARQLYEMPIVVVHYGLFGFAQDITNIIARNWLWPVYGAQQLFNFDLDVDMSKKAIMICLSFLSEQPIAAKDRLFALPTEWKNLFSEYNTSLRDEMELFILAHEFGHIFSPHQPMCEHSADKWAIEILLQIPPVYALGSYYTTHKFAPAAGLVALYSHQLLEYVRTNFDAIVKKFGLGSLKLHYPPHGNDGNSHPLP